MWGLNEGKIGGKNLDYQSEFTECTILFLLPLYQQEFCVFAFLILLSSLRKHSCGAGAVTVLRVCGWQGTRVALYGNEIVLFSLSGISALLHQLTSVFPLDSFSAPQMAKAKCPSNKYMQINIRHEVTTLWSCEWLLFWSWNMMGYLLGVVALRFLKQCLKIVYLKNTKKFDQNSLNLWSYWS